MRHCLAIDLKEDEQLYEEYEVLHRAVWPEIIASIKEAGIYELEIYRVANRLIMIMETGPDFSFEKKNEMDKANPKVQDWETLMWKYQQALPLARPGEKWVRMQKVFEL